MQRISRAPVLSATRKRLSCWITLRPPARGRALRQRALRQQALRRPEPRAPRPPALRPALLRQQALRQQALRRPEPRAPRPPALRPALLRLQALRPQTPPPEPRAPRPPSSRPQAPRQELRPRARAARSALRLSRSARCRSYLSQALVSLVRLDSRSMRMVRMRAISRLASFRRAVFSRAPVAPWKRRLKSSWRVSANRVSSSSSVRSRSSLARKEISLPRHHSSLDRQLPAREAQGFLGKPLVDAGQLEHDAARLDDGDPVLGRALAGAHAGLGRLLGHRLVREDVDPDLAASADLAGHRDSCRLDLPAPDPAPLQRPEAVVARLHRPL